MAIGVPPFLSNERDPELFAKEMQKLIERGFEPPGFSDKGLGPWVT